MKANALEKLLICPICSGHIAVEISKEDELGIEDGKIICLNCRNQYSIKERIIDLRTGIKNSGLNQNQWELESFEKGYARTGYYKNGMDWARMGKYPSIVEEFRYPKVKGLITKWLEPKNGEMILDLGCGVGWFIFEIMKIHHKIDLFFVGLDPAISNIYWLNYRSREENKDNLLGILGEAESLPFSDNLFDKIITSEVIEHIFDKGKAINQMHRVLKPNGQLFITTPARPTVEFWNGFFWLPQQIKRLFRPQSVLSTEKAAYDEPVTQSQLRQYLQKAGFAVERFQQNALMPHESYFQFFPYWLSWSIIKTASFIEKYFKPLFNWAGLHYVVKAKK